MNSKMIEIKKEQLKTTGLYYWQIFLVCHIFSNVPTLLLCSYSFNCWIVHLIWFFVYTIGCLCYYYHYNKLLKIEYNE